jgi:hypothetical protein
VRPKRHHVSERNHRRGELEDNRKGVVTHHGVFSGVDIVHQTLLSEFGGLHRVDPGICGVLEAVGGDDRDVCV